MQQMLLTPAEKRTFPGEEGGGRRRGGGMPLRQLWLLLCATLATLQMTSFVHGAETKWHPQPVLEVEALRAQYIGLEQALWTLLNRKESTPAAAQLKKVFDSHRKFIGEHLQQRNFEAGKYEILNHYEWSLLERDLLQVDGIFGYFKNFLATHNNSAALDERALLDICDTVLRNDKTFSMSRIFQDTELIMVKQTMYYRAMTESAEQMCHTQQSSQQFVYSLYTDIALTELKGFTMMEFSWMILRIYGKGNFTQEAELMRSDYQERTERTLRLLREVMRRARRDLYRCDPAKYVSGETYDEVTRLLQGYVENEVDMHYDGSCFGTCNDYNNVKSQGCFKNLYCSKQPRCTGKLYSCSFVDSDMWVCPAAWNSTRRYEYIEYENGSTLGKKVQCTRGTTKVDSWWRYLFWHCSYCFCLCDEMGPKSDRYFNLRESLSDVSNNKVVTGLRFVKKNRIFHLQIQEGELQPRGVVNASSLVWRPVATYNIYDDDARNGRDFHTLRYESRVIDLDDIHTDDTSFVVTGVRFRLVGTHLNLEARLSEFDFETGRLVETATNSFWKSNDNTDVSGERREKVTLKDPDVPTRTIVKSTVNSKHNQFIEFTNTNQWKDAAQSTVPFLDTQDVVSQPPVPLAGIGIYHKGRDGYGGFIAPKIITYDYTQHVQVPKSQGRSNSGK